MHVQNTIAYTNTYAKSTYTNAGSVSACPKHCVHKYIRKRHVHKFRQRECKRKCCVHKYRRHEKKREGRNYAEKASSNMDKREAGHFFRALSVTVAVLCVS